MSIFGALGFVNPFLLWGLLAVSIPIIIHLINLRRVKRVQFSNTALLKRVKEETSAKRRPIELLILISRILGVALLVLSFAGPLYKDGDSDVELGENVLVYLDNSQSLSAKAQDIELFDLAYNSANGIISSYGEGTSFHFLENAYSNSISTQYTQASLLDYLTEINKVSVGRTLQEILERKQGFGNRGDTYIISDFQDVSGLNGIANDSTSQYFLVPLQAEEFDNSYVDTAYLENTFLSGTLSNVLKIGLRRNSRENDVQNLKIYFGDQLSGTAQIDFQDQLLAEYTFEIPSGQRDIDQIKIELDDPGLSFDNEYFLTINRLERINVLEIIDDTRNSYISSLYSDNELFRFERQRMSSLDNQKIQSSDFIVLNELESLSNQLVNSINAFMSAGGTVVIIPSVNMPGNDFSRIGLQVIGDDEQKLNLASPNYQNPFFDGIFEERNTSLDMPTATTLWRLVNEELSYLSFENGRSFLSKANGNGSVFFFASTFDFGQSSFANHALFVPVMYKLALGSKSDLTRLYHYTDSEVIIYPLDSEITGVVSLRNINGTIIPDQRVEGEQLIMTVPKDEIEPGQYDLILSDEKFGALSFNLPKTESTIGGLNMDLLRNLEEAPNVTLIEAGSRAEVQQNLTAGINGIELWKYALLGALFFLFAEIILIRYL